MTQQDCGAALGAALGGGYVNYFSIAGRSYKVIPQVLQADRLNPVAGARLLHPGAERQHDAGIDCGDANRWKSCPSPSIAFSN